MTEEEKKEFEEFLEWKKQKKAKEAKEKENSIPQPTEGKVNPSVAEDKSSQSPQLVDGPTEFSEYDNSPELEDDSAESLKHVNSSSNVSLIIGIIVTVIIVFVISSKCSNQNATSANEDATEVDTVSTLNNDASPSEDPSSTTMKGWTRSEETDPMNDSKSVFVSVTSNNTNKLDFPYGDVNVTLTVRRMKKYGVDVLVRSSNGQIYGSEYDGENYVTVRFDSNKPMRFYFDEASDGSSDVVFLRKRSAFIKAAKKAHKITLEVPYYQAGRQVFTFTTPKPLKW